MNKKIAKVIILMQKLTRNRCMMVSSRKNVINMYFETIACNPPINITSEIAPDGSSNAFGEMSLLLCINMDKKQLWMIN